MRCKVLSLLAVAASLGFAQAASAADMPTKAPMAPVAAAINWTGFYVGIEGGGQWASSQWTRPSTAISTGNFTGSGEGVGRHYWVQLAGAWQ